MDEINRINRERWNALARANVPFSRLYLNYTMQEAEANICRHGVLKDLDGKNVLCLASGGGQDSVAFGLLGAQVSVLDLSDEQLARDRQAAVHHNLPTRTIQGDMRDLSAFPDNHFDVVWQIYSINFVPDVKTVAEGVARVLKSGGVYFLQFANPFVIGIESEDWDGKAYPLNMPYRDGVDITTRFPYWDVEQPDGSTIQMASPHEFRHTLGRVINTLIASGFVLIGLWEWMERAENPQPGSWEHFTQVAPPYLETFWRKS